MPGRLMVGHMALDHVILVRIQARQHFDKLRPADLSQVDVCFKKNFLVK